MSQCLSVLKTEKLPSVLGSFSFPGIHLHIRCLMTSFNTVVSIVRIELPALNPAVSGDAGRRTLSPPRSRPVAAWTAFGAVTSMSALLS